ncbi:hypothetical protein ACUND2_22440 [Serratia sp. IR-2025]
MKITDMPNNHIRETILNAAQCVLADSADMAHMLQKVDQFLAYDFEDPFTDKPKGQHIVEALNRGNGCIHVALYVEADGTVSGHNVMHEFPLDKGTPVYIKVSELESQAYQKALASMKGKTFTKRTIVKWFLEYAPEMVY